MWFWVVCSAWGMLQPSLPPVANESQIIIGHLADHVKFNEIQLRDANGQLLTLALGKVRTAKTGSQKQYDTDLSQIPVNTLLKIEIKAKAVVGVEVLYSWHEMPALWVDEWIDHIAHTWGQDNEILGNKTIVTAIIGMVFIPETKNRDIYLDDRPR